MIKWLKFELRNHKYILFGILLFVYGVLLPYTLQMISLDNNIEIERIFTQVKYFLSLIEIMFLYMMLKHILSGECIEVVFSIKPVPKYLYLVVSLFIFTIMFIPLFTYYYIILDTCLYDIFDCFFLFIFLSFFFYAITFVSKTMLISLFSVFLVIVICNNFSNTVLWNIFHPMIRPYFLDPSFYIVYSFLGFALFTIGQKLEKSYIY